MRITSLKEAEFNPYYGQYIEKLSHKIELRPGFEASGKVVSEFFEAISDTQLLYRYAPEKWSIKEIIQHLIDTERIFMYRCFRIARKDPTPLAGFNQDIYIAPSGAQQKSKQTLLNEYQTVRNAFIVLLNSLSDDDLTTIGNANDSPMSARAAAFVILGHEIWHCDVIRERYL